MHLNITYQVWIFSHSPGPSVYPQCSSVFLSPSVGEAHQTSHQGTSPVSDNACCPDNSRKGFVFSFHIMIQI